MSILFANELAALLGIDQDAVYEAARAKRLPFGVLTEPQRRLFVRSVDLDQWREALEAPK
jgi:hypothetical protein